MFRRLISFVLFLMVNMTCASLRTQYADSQDTHGVVLDEAMARELPVNNSFSLPSHLSLPNGTSTLVFDVIVKKIEGNMFTCEIKPRSSNMLVGMMSGSVKMPTASDSIGSEISVTYATVFFSAAYGTANATSVLVSCNGGSADGSRWTSTITGVSPGRSDWPDYGLSMFKHANVEFSSYPTIGSYGSLTLALA